MKRVLTIAGLTMGLLWGQHAAAQPINYGAGNNSPGTQMRAKNKADYDDEAQARVARLKKSFDGRKREKDPFGTRMDPGVFQPVNVPLEDLVKSEPAAPERKIPTQEAVQKFQPNLLSATQQLVMINGHTLHVGNLVQIEYQGVLFKLRITKITADEVHFINTENQEKAIYREPEFDPTTLDEDESDILNRLNEKEEPFIIKDQN